MKEKCERNKEREMAMNLILNVNESLHSIKGSADGELKSHAAIEEAVEEIRLQIRKNKARIESGLRPLPYKAVVKDEYGKDLVTIRETRTLGEIRQEYQRIQSSQPADRREKSLLAAMDEIGNSERDEAQFRDELSRQLSSSLFLNTAELSPAQEKILDFFGDTSGMFSTINFKESISEKCIKDLIDLPDPKTGKPPKTFSHLLSNIMSIDRIFQGNPSRERYIETARGYISLRYQRIIPPAYRQLFRTRGGIFPLVERMAEEEAKKRRIDSMDFEVSEKNFKRAFQSLCGLEQFKDRPQALANYLIQRVPEDGKETFVKWMVSMGCRDAPSTLRVMSKWAAEAERGKASRGMRGSRKREPERE